MYISAYTYIYVNIENNNTDTCGAFHPFAGAHRRREPATRLRGGHLALTQGGHEPQVLYIYICVYSYHSLPLSLYIYIYAYI